MASHFAVVAGDFVEEIHPPGRSQHPLVEVFVAESCLAAVDDLPDAVADLPSAASVIVMTLV